MAKTNDGKKIMSVPSYEKKGKRAHSQGSCKTNCDGRSPMQRYHVFKVLLTVAVVVILSASTGARAQDHRVLSGGLATDQADIDRQFQTRMDRAARMDPQIMNAMNDPTLPISTVMAEAIKRSEHPAEILRYLNSHRVEAKRIFDMDTISAAREIGLIEASIVIANPPPQTAQPAQNWVLWRKVTIWAGAGNQMGSNVTWDILKVLENKTECERYKQAAPQAFKDTPREYDSQGTWGETLNRFYCLPEMIDPRR